MRKGHRVKKLTGNISRNPPRASNPNQGPSSRKCHRVPSTKRLPYPRSRSSHWVPIASTPLSPSPQRWPRILGAKHPRRVWTIQQSVYYISEVLHDAKTRYLEVHKLLYAVLIASRKLHHYFQAQKISVVTSYPLKAVLHNPNATGNSAKWAAELTEFELDFLSRHVVKSHALADFVADWTMPPCNPRGLDDSEPEAKALVFTVPYLMLFFDGSSRRQGAGAGVLLLTPEGE
jgi:hypothetical protein